MDYKITAQEIIKKIGGLDNIDSVVHCATRLRFKLKDPTVTEISALKKIDGVIMVIESAGQLQVVIGNNVSFVHQAIMSFLEKNQNHSSAPSNKQNSTKKAKISKNPLNTFIDLISGIFVPILGVMTATGIIKGLISLLLATNLITEDSGTYQLLYVGSDGLFFFLPIFLGYTAGKKFGTNPILTMAIGAAMVHPIAQEQFNLVFGAELNHTTAPSYSFFGIPIDYINYASSVIPIVFSAWICAKLEKFFSNFFHSSIRNIFSPVCCLLIVVPLTFLLIGPISNYLAKGLAFGYSMLYLSSPVICGLVLGGLWQVLVIFGLHWGIIPITYNNIANFGKDSLLPLFFPAVMAQTAATFAVLFKSRDPKVKSLSVSATVSGIFGVTEPAIYGITLPRKRPFIFGCIGGAIGGAIVGYYQSSIYSVGLITIFSYAQLIPKTGIDTTVVGAIIASIIGAAIAFLLTLLFYKEEQFLTHQQSDNANDNTTPATSPSDSTVSPSEARQNYSLRSPFHGEIIPIEEVPDATFSSELLGKSIAILPSSTQLIAPTDGEVIAIAETKHSISICADNGAEILIHIGIDTVTLEGKPFTVHVEIGQKITTGDLLITFDKAMIENAGISLITPMIITNDDEFEIAQPELSGTVNPSDILFYLSPKK